MIVDLANQAIDHRNIETDVLIVGAGIAGLVLADRLRRKNVRVTILESGGRDPSTDGDPLNQVIQLGDPYTGATQGRSRCLGGTSTMWGGALLPFLTNDLAARPYLGLPAFPVRMEELAPYLPEVDKLFGLDSGSYEEEFVRQIGASRRVPTGDDDFQVRFAKWPPFKNRNLALLLSKMLADDADLEVSVNSTVTEFEMSEGGRVTLVTARHESGRSVTVGAKRIVICAGAIETTRLLLLLDRQHESRIFQECEALGRYFYDHISLPVAEIEPRDVNRLNRMAGFRFVGSTMRSLRFELTPRAQSSEGVGSAFGHISFRTTGSTGFDALRQFMRFQQRTGRIELCQLLSVVSELPYFVRVGFWRAFHRQLLWPRPAVYELHVVAEQLPKASNRVTLSVQRDVLGLPVAAIDWRVTSEDWRTFAVFGKRFDSFWTRRGLQAIGTLKWLNQANEGSGAPASQTDVYHPGGSTRMGADPRTSVLDPNLKVFGISNLWTASTAAFPSGGGANPTLTLILFVMRLADHLASRSDIASGIKVPVVTS